MEKMISKCENCEAFSPNFQDHAYLSGQKCKCLLFGINVSSDQIKCERFNLDPKQVKE